MGRWLQTVTATVQKLKIEITTTNPASRGYTKLSEHLDKYERFGDEAELIKYDWKKCKTAINRIHRAGDKCRECAEKGCTSRDPKTYKCMGPCQADLGRRRFEKNQLEFFKEEG